MAFIELHGGCSRDRVPAGRRKSLWMFIPKPIIWNYMECYFFTKIVWSVTLLINALSLIKEFLEISWNCSMKPGNYGGLHPRDPTCSILFHTQRWPQGLQLPVVFDRQMITMGPGRSWVDSLRLTWSQTWNMKTIFRPCVLMVFWILWWDFPQDLESSSMGHNMSKLKKERNWHALQTEAVTVNTPRNFCRYSIFGFFWKCSNGT